MRPEVLVQLRNELVADAEGFNVHRRQHRGTRIGEGVEVRRSHQAVACRKRDVREPGKSQEFLCKVRLRSRQGWRHRRVKSPETRVYSGGAVRQGATQVGWQGWWPYANGVSYQA